MDVDVGSLRQQCALCDSDTRVVVVSNDPTLKDLVVEEFYPDTTNEHDDWEGTFKIKVRRKT